MYTYSDLVYFRLCYFFVLLLVWMCCFYMFRAWREILFLGCLSLLYIYICNRSMIRHSPPIRSALYFPFGKCSLYKYIQIYSYSFSEIMQSLKKRLVFLVCLHQTCSKHIKWVFLHLFAKRFEKQIFIGLGIQNVKKRCKHIVLQCSAHVLRKPQLSLVFASQILRYQWTSSFVFLAKI